MYVRVYVCVCVCVCVRVCVRGVTCKEMVGRHLTCTYVCMLMSAHQLMHIRTYVCIRMHIRTYVCIRMYIRMYVPHIVRNVYVCETHMHENICMHTILHISAYSSSVRYVVACTYDAGSMLDQPHLLKQVSLRFAHHRTEQIPVCQLLGGGGGRRGEVKEVGWGKSVLHVF